MRPAKKRSFIYATIWACPKPLRQGAGLSATIFFAGGPTKKDFRCYPSRFGWKEKSKGEVTLNLKELIKDYQQNEGKKDKFWNKVEVENMEVEIFFNLQAFFKEFNKLKISSLAEKAALNPSLLRQYASGHKYPSIDQAKKLEIAVPQLAKKLSKVAIYA